MKIKQTKHSMDAAQNILNFLNGDLSNEGFSVSILGNELFFNSNAHTLLPDEIVLIDRLESDSMGDGWENANPVDVIQWIGENIEL